MAISAKELKQARKDQILRLAHDEGLKAASVVGAISILAVGGAWKYYPRFKSLTNASARTALAISPPIFTYALRSELVMNGASRDPKSYGITVDAAKAHIAAEKATERLTYPKQAANWLYEHPLKFILGMSFPIIGGFLWTMRDKGHLTLSQKLMHTRVYAQGSIILMLMSTMAFSTYMQNRGGVFTAEYDSDGFQEEDDVGQDRKLNHTA